MILYMDPTDPLRSVYNSYVFAAPVISADILSAVVETILFTRTGAANAFDLVSASKKKTAMSPHAAHREAQARGLRASNKSIVCAVKMSKYRHSRDRADAPSLYMSSTQLHAVVPGPRHSDVDLGRVEGRDVMRCEAIHSRRFM